MPAIEDVKALVEGKPAAISTMATAALTMQEAVRLAKRVDLRETFGNEEALQAQVAASLKDIALLRALRVKIGAELLAANEALAAIDGPLERVAAEYVPEPAEEGAGI